jgi:glucosamine--fructose-6-phosphate aminotransferase (isomerizing)
LTPSFAEGVAAQPENLRAARERFCPVELEGTVVFSGIGASWYALMPAVRSLQAAGRRAFAVRPGDVAAGIADAYVFVSQSGRSAETLAAAERVAGAPVVAVSAAGDSPVAHAASAWLPLGDVPDTPLSTLGYTATLQALGMLSESLIHGRPGDEWGRVPEMVADVLARGPVLADLLTGARVVDVVGAGTAGAAALLLREALRLAASAEETRQYLHGPLEAVGEGFACIVFGAARERELAAAMASYGARAAVVGPGAGGAGEGVIAVELPAASDLVAPILEILPVQLAVAHVAAARGHELAGLTRPQDDTKLATPLRTRSVD